MVGLRLLFGMRSVVVCNHSVDNDTITASTGSERTSKLLFFRRSWPAFGSDCRRKRNASPCDNAAQAQVAELVDFLRCSILNDMKLRSRSLFAELVRFEMISKPKVFDRYDQVIERYRLAIAPCRHDRRLID